MRRMLVAMGMLLAVSAVGMRAQGDAKAAEPDVWEQLRTANNLELEGKTPFDLAMTFQLYDLDGKPTVTGSVEEWWAAPGSMKIVVHLAGLNEDGGAPDGADPVLVRYAYLVSQLLEEATVPVPKKPWLVTRQETKDGKVVANATPVTVQSTVSTKRVKLGKVALDCTAPAIADPTSAVPTMLCVEPQSTDVLLLQGWGGKETVLRSRTAKFRDTYVPLELKIDYLGKEAIAGTLTTMKVWEPPSSEIKVPVGATATTNAASLPGGVIAGHRISYVEPVYPEMAKVGHASGAVLLHAIIGEDGKVDRLVPVASTNPMFTSSAIDAVRKWTYSPYLLNGKPTSVDTTITVNFALNY